MQLSTLKTGRRLISLIVVSVLSLAFFGAYGLQRLSSYNETVHATLNKLEKSSRSINLARSAQGALGNQVKEWKDLLIDGNTSLDFKKHLEAFNKQYNEAQNNLESLTSLVTELSLDPGKISDTIKIHNRLLAMQTDVLQGFNPVEEGAGKALEKLVAEMDRETTHSMGTLVEGIIFENHKLQDQMVSELDIQYEDAKTKTALCLFLALLVLGAVSMSAVQPVAPPLGENAAFPEEVAAGHLDAPSALVSHKGQQADYFPELCGHVPMHFGPEQGFGSSPGLQGVSLRG